MASQAVWADFDSFVQVFLPRQTIAKLRQFSEVIHQHAGMNLYLKSNERKSDLVAKVKAAFDTMKKTNAATTYLTVRRECERITNAKYRPSAVPMPQPTFGGVPPRYNVPSSASRAAAASSSTSAFSAHGSTPAWQQGSGSHQHATHKPRQAVLADWKPSPMWKPIRALTTMEQLPDIMPSESSHTRKEKRVYFSLSEDVISLLNKSKADPRSRPLYSVRLFCTSSEHYRPQGMAPQAGVPPPTNRCVPIEYPVNPDVSLDDHMVPFKERGLRGKAGSAPPLDLDRGSRGLVRIPGRMASLIMGHSGPTVSKNKNVAKKFFFQVVFCEFTSMEDLLVRLEALDPTDPATELEKMKKQAEDDDDIQVGPSTLSLKDPLSGMRIAKPIRSSKCSHLQCFDARWWLESNKSHPQWNCPHCSKELVFDDVICDGYFLSILNSVPDTVDEVILESNGEWHTSDNKHHSSGWVPPTPVVSAPPTAVSTPGFTAKRERSPTPDPTAGKRRAIEVLSDSSDDEHASSSRPNGANGHGHGHGLVRSNQPSAAPSGPSRASSSRASLGVTPAVIDLTLSSDEEDNDTDAEAVPNFRQPGGGSTRPEGGVSDRRPAEQDLSSIRAAGSVSDRRPAEQGSFNYRAETSVAAIQAAQDKAERERRLVEKARRDLQARQAQQAQSQHQQSQSQPHQARPQPPQPQRAQSAQSAQSSQVPSSHSQSSQPQPSRTPSNSFGNQAPVHEDTYRPRPTSSRSDNFPAGFLATLEQIAGASGSTSNTRGTQSPHAPLPRLPSHPPPSHSPTPNGYAQLLAGLDQSRASPAPAPAPALHSGFRVPSQPSRPNSIPPPPPSDVPRPPSAGPSPSAAAASAAASPTHPSPRPSDAQRPTTPQHAYPPNGYHQ